MTTHVDKWPETQNPWPDVLGGVCLRYKLGGKGIVFWFHVKYSQWWRDMSVTDMKPYGAPFSAHLYLRWTLSTNVGWRNNFEKTCGGRQACLLTFFLSCASVSKKKHSANWTDRKQKNKSHPPCEHPCRCSNRLLTFFIHFTKRDLISICHSNRQTPSI